MDQTGVTPRDGCRLGWDEVCQRNYFDGVFAGAVSFAGVVELRPGSSGVFVSILILGNQPSEGVPSVGHGSTDPSLLEAKGWQRRIGLLVLCQRWRHPAIVRMAKDEAFLCAGFGCFSKCFLEVHLNG